MDRQYVVVLSGPLQGQEYDIADCLSIGRSPDNAVQLNDLQVSRRHAVVQRTPTGTILRDLNSGNGTYVGERRVLEYRLSDGDVFRIGPLELRYEGPSEKAGAQHERVHFEQEDASLVEASDISNVYQTFFQEPKGTVSAEQLRKAQRRLQAVYEANEIIASERELDRLFERVMEQIFSLVPAHNGVILLKDGKTGKCKTAFIKTGAAQEEVSISSTIVQRTIEKGEAVITFNAASDARFEAGESIIAENISSAMCVPLIHQDETLGVVYVDTRGATSAFTQNDLEMLVALSGPAAVAIKNAQYVTKLEKSYKDTLLTIANTVEMRDHYTVGHTWRVTRFALEIARELGWDQEQLNVCERGGLLHDVGKIAIDDAILRKPSGLTQDEYEKMKIHPERGARLLRDSEFLVPLVPYALYHHERFDGKGYPFGLAGENIPIEGRIIAVADTFDAMTSNRPYRKGLDPAIAVAEIEKGKTTQFDPACVDAFIAAYKKGRIDPILQEYNKGEKSVVCPFCSTYVRIPEGCKESDRIECGVCHRKLRLHFKNDTWFADLVPATETVVRAGQAASK